MPGVVASNIRPLLRAAQKIVQAPLLLLTEYQLAKKARPVREDHLERQETAEELRERIRVLFKLKQTPDDKHVKFLLSRLEKYKRTGYV